MTYAKQELWDWLKTERKWKDKAHQWLRAEGVDGNTLENRRQGKPEAPRSNNRSGRRARQFA